MTFTFKLYVCIGAYFLIRVIRGALIGGPVLLFHFGWTAAIVLGVLLLGRLLTHFMGMPYMRKLSVGRGWLVFAGVCSSIVTKGWLSDLIFAFVMVLFAWDEWRDGHGKRSRVGARLDKWKRALLDKVRQRTPTPQPLPTN